MTQDSVTYLPQNKSIGLPLPREFSRLGVYPIKRGLAEELGARDRHGRGFGFDERAIGTDVTGYDPCGWWEENPEKKKREKLPPGHRYFSDCLRESQARMIFGLSNHRDLEGWFVTRTFKEYVSPAQGEKLSNVFFGRLTEAHRQATAGAGPLHWVSASEWQKRGVIHYHDLIYGARLDELSRKRWEHRWQGEIGGGFARIHAAVAKAAPYLAKYASKTQGGELRWSNTWRGISASKSVSCCQV